LGGGEGAELAAVWLEQYPRRTRTRTRKINEKKKKELTKKRRVNWSFHFF
jgi:hypothetical protein